MPKFKLSNWLEQLPKHYIVKNLKVNANIINIEIFIDEELEQLLKIKHSD
tara:strand:- start:500 stop:649 length:150 start_codon:yes stop_codon:yes gene_type:complete